MQGLGPAWPSWFLTIETSMAAEATLKGVARSAPAAKVTNRVPPQRKDLAAPATRDEMSKPPEPTPGWGRREASQRCDRGHVTPRPAGTRDGIDATGTCWPVDDSGCFVLRIEGHAGLPSSRARLR